MTPTTTRRMQRATGAAIALAVLLALPSVPRTAWATAGDFYAAGVGYCARTYAGHSTPPGFGPSADLNATGGDLNRPIYAPEPGTVEVYTTDGAGDQGWGNSIFWHSADGRESIHVAHLNEITRTGSVGGGVMIGRAGNTGNTSGGAPDHGAHLHVSRRFDGGPAPLVLSGRTIQPGSSSTCTSGPAYTVSAGQIGGAAPPGPVAFDDAVYTFRSRPVVTVRDPDAPSSQTQAEVTVTSDADPAGFRLSLAVVEPGVFSGSFALASRATDAAASMLKAAEGDRIVARYGTENVVAGIADVFSDDRGLSHEPNVNAIWRAGVTGGCGPGRYCPQDPVQRMEMAAFLARALELPPATGDHFDDDTGLPLEGAVNRLFEAGITGGCAERRFCPRDPVTRAEMATFLVRAFGLPQPASLGHFDDVPESSPHRRNINALFEAGLTGGCAARLYCPADPVKRSEMATFLARGFAYP